MTSILVEPNSYEENTLTVYEMHSPIHLVSIAKAPWRLLLQQQGCLVGQQYMQLQVEVSVRLQQMFIEAVGEAVTMLQVCGVWCVGWGVLLAGVVYCVWGGVVYGRGVRCIGRVGCVGCVSW